ncbi:MULTISPECIES: heavy-metal-associated domain-containing protein [unclassified Nonomuraea]|uniref:heavy-metal-associated domain-containing protein n=1 Tax=unclassified Nonomuraea TaxID=2593643 RepID=UPI0033EDD34E
MCTACACGTEQAAAATATTDSGDQSVYSVSGMTCGHCVSSVSAEIGKVDGVAGVAVELSTGTVTVTGTGFSGEEIRAAVERAGYRLAGTAS